MQVIVDTTYRVNKKGIDVLLKLFFALLCRDHTYFANKILKLFSTTLISVFNKTWICMQHDWKHNGEGIRFIFNKMLILHCVTVILP